MESEVTNEQVLQLDPSVVLADSNVRFSLKAPRVEALAEEITAIGRVHTPLLIEPLAEVVNGCQYRVTDGHYRKAAVELLNKSGAALTLPCIVRSPEEGVNRLKLQLSCNKDRENLSPMDRAIAIKQLKDAGVPVIEIRKMFSVPGGRKGGVKVAPASNSFINMHLSFLEFPKKIQEKIHAGEQGGIGVLAAYRLSKAPRDKWEAIIQEAETEREEQIKREAADEEKLLAQEKKAQETVEKEKKLKEDLEAAKKAAAEASQAIDAKNDAAAAAYAAHNKMVGTSYPDKSPEAEAKKKAFEALQAAEQELKDTKKAAEDAKKEATKLEERLKKQAQQAEERAKRLKELQKKGKADKNKKGPTANDIDKASAKLGAGNYVPLNATQMREFVKLVCTPGGSEKVRLVGRIFDSVFTGRASDKHGFSALLSVFKENSKGFQKDSMSTIKQNDPLLFADL